MESESNLGTPLVELGVACGGPATEQWRRRPAADGGGAAPAVRGRGERSGSFTTPCGSYIGGLLGLRSTGVRGSAEAWLGGGNGGGDGVLGAGRSSALGKGVEWEGEEASPRREMRGEES